MRKKLLSASIVFLLTVGAVISIVNLISEDVVASDWEFETVDSGGLVGCFTSIALDSSGYPHISYFDWTNGDLKYARWTGSAWIIETVDSGGKVGGWTAIALDSSGYAHISYYDWTNGDLKYARWMGGTWSIETVDSAGDVGNCTSIALDNNGYAHISYHDETNESLKYARWTGSTWSIETVDSTGEVGCWTSIALDDNSYPHISYADMTNDDLKYARWTGSSWSNETVAAGGNVGDFTSIALDSSDYPHISYRDETNKDLKYASWTGSTWSIETVDSAGDVGLFTSIALDSNGYAHISYTDYTNTDLKYAKWTGSAWSIETVDSTDNVGIYTSIALDSCGYPHISYLGEGPLSYAKKGHPNQPPTCTISSPSPGARLNGTVEISGSASDSDGTVQNVEIRIDNDDWIQVGGTTSWSYNWNTTIVSSGQHTIHVRAYDGIDFSTWQSIPVTVNQLPTCTISSPSPGAILNGTVEISGTASDIDSTVQNVEIRIDGDSWMQVTGTTSWSYSLDTTELQDGQHTIYARAYDGTDFSMWQNISVTVDNPNQPPTCTISSHSSREKISKTTVISGIAYDPDGVVQMVEIKIDDGGWIEVSGTTFWSYDLDTTTLSNGAHTIYIRSYDGENYSFEISLNLEVDNPLSKEPEEEMLVLLGAITAIIIVILIIAALLALRKKKSTESIPASLVQPVMFQTAQPSQPFQLPQYHYPLYQPQQTLEPPRQEPPSVIGQKKYCAFCGAELPAEAKFCSKCGKKQISGKKNEKT